MSSCKTKQYLFEMYYQYISIFQKQKSAQQLNSFTAIHRPQDGQQKASRELYTLEVKESRNHFSEMRCQGHQELVTVSEHHIETCNGLMPSLQQTYNWQHIIWWLQEYAWYNPKYMISYDIYWSMFDYGGVSSCIVYKYRIM